MPDESIAALANQRNFRVTRDPRGVVTAVLDVPDRGQNVFNEDVIFELQQIVNEMEHDPSARLLLFRSGKDSGFLAGADLHQIVAIRSPQTADQVLTIGQKLFDRIERLPMPAVAVIHGPCLGGGLEFAMACRYRVALDDRATRLGSPEVELGLSPGWGGTQRLPQLVGLASALLDALDRPQAVRARRPLGGLVDAVWPPEEFSHGVEQFVLDRLEGKPLARRRPGFLARRFLARLRNRTRLGQRLVLWAAGRRTAALGRHYPALPAILSAVERGLRCGCEEGLARERAGFAELLFTPACRNLMGIFFQREQARKPGHPTLRARPAAATDPPGRRGRGGHHGRRDCPIGRLRRPGGCSQGCEPRDPRPRPAADRRLDGESETKGPSLRGGGRGAPEGASTGIRVGTRWPTWTWPSRPFRKMRTSSGKFSGNWANVFPRKR